MKFWTPTRLWPKFEADNDYYRFHSPFTRCWHFGDLNHDWFSLTKYTTRYSNRLFARVSCALHMPFSRRPETKRPMLLFALMPAGERPLSDLSSFRVCCGPNGNRRVVFLIRQCFGRETLRPPIEIKCDSAAQIHFAAGDGRLALCSPLPRPALFRQELYAIGEKR